uniref:Spire type actin nucleation factor 2 n=1 Tax=Sphenodon punctatus TaxID=8508 RepID=A0A8D0L581_SPHPU
MARAAAAAAAAAGVPEELSLEEVLKAYEQPINEEQAWAPRWGPAGRIRDTTGILLHKDGTVTALGEQGAAGPAWTSIAVYPWPKRECSFIQEKESTPLPTWAANLGGCPCKGWSYWAYSNRMPAPAGVSVQVADGIFFLLQMLKKLKEEDKEPEDRSAADLDNLRNTDWARLWVQLMRELRHGVKLKKVQEKQFNPLPTEYHLTPFEMLMQDIRARNYKLRKVMVDGDIPPRVKKDAHELILDFIRSRPPLKQASERRLRPLPQKQRTLHEKILEEIKQERKLRPVEARNQKGFGSLPCLAHACPSDMKSTSCIDLSGSGSSAPAQRQRPRVLLKAPTLAELEEMNLSEARREPGAPTSLKRDRSFSEQDLAQFRSESSSEAGSEYPGPQESEPRPRSGSLTPAWTGMKDQGKFLPLCSPKLRLPLRRWIWSTTRPPAAPLCAKCPALFPQEFSHPVESLALTVEEMINVRRVLVKAEMEKFLQSKELYSNLKKGKICCCCRTKFPLFSWPSTCLFCKRSVCSSCSLKIKMPSKKLAHIPVYALGFENLPGSLAAKGLPLRKRESFRSLHGTRWRSVEEEYPHIYAHGSILKDVCSNCTSFVTDVVSSSRKSVDILNTTPRKGRKTQSLYIPSS